MKDHKHYILWLDYFNSTYPRSESRRVPLSRAVRNPKIEELVEAARQLGYQVQPVDAIHPRRLEHRSHYISIEKTGSKAKIIADLAKKLTAIKSGAPR